MTILEYVLVATFVSLGLVPLVMAMSWELRLRALTRRADAAGSRGVPQEQRDPNLAVRP